MSARITSEARQSHASLAQSYNFDEDERDFLKFSNIDNYLTNSKFYYPKSFQQVETTKVEKVVNVLIADDQIFNVSVFEEILQEIENVNCDVAYNG